MDKNDYLDFAERFTKYVTDINNMVGAIPNDFAQQIHDFCELAQRDYPLLREKYNKPRKMKYYLLLNITEVPSAEEIVSISSGNDKWEFLRKCAADLTLFNSEIADMYNLNAQQMERLNKIIAQSPTNSAYSISVFDKIRQGREDEVIHSNNEHDRFLAATAGIGLDVLVHDESSLVRAEVAKQGYGLDILVHDVNSYVQIRVAEQGYGLDILKESEFEPLAMIANAMLVLQENNGKSFIENDLLMHEFRNIPKEVFLDIHKDISSDDYDRTAFDVAERIGDHFDVNGRWIASKMLITDNAVNVMEIFRTRLSNNFTEDEKEIRHILSDFDEVDYSRLAVKGKVQYNMSLYGDYPQAIARFDIDISLPDAMNLLGNNGNQFGVVGGDKEKFYRGINNGDISLSAYVELFNDAFCTDDRQNGVLFVVRVSGERSGDICVDFRGKDGRALLEVMEGYAQNTLGKSLADVMHEAKQCILEAYADREYGCDQPITIRINPIFSELISSADGVSQYALRIDDGEYQDIYDRITFNGGAGYTKDVYTLYDEVGVDFSLRATNDSNRGSTELVLIEDNPDTGLSETNVPLTAQEKALLKQVLDGLDSKQHGEGKKEHKKPKTDIDR